MIRARTATLAIVLIAVALVSSGCVAIKSQSASQRAPGVVTLSLQVCVNDLDGTRYQDCKPPSNTAENDNGQDAISDPPLPANGQLLVGFRVPDGTTAPGELPEHGRAPELCLEPGLYQRADRRVPARSPGSTGWGTSRSGFTFDGTTAANFLFTFNPEFGLPPGRTARRSPGRFAGERSSACGQINDTFARQLAH